MTLSEMKELIELVAEKRFAEFSVERSDVKLRIVGAGAQVLPVALQSGPETNPFVAHAPLPPPVRSVPSSAPTDPVPAAAPDDAGPAPEAAIEGSMANLHLVKSPIVGTFYRSPSPTSDPFVKTGDMIEAGTVLCIVEAMKLMNEIEADASGEIVKVFVENGQPVEYGQPLFGIRT